MSACRKCGLEITFRWMDGIVRPFHAYGMPCGERSPYSDETVKSSVRTLCPECQKMVYLVRHNGGSVWLDELGWPWPKHGCFDVQLGRNAAEPLRVVRHERVKVPLPPINTSAQTTMKRHEGKRENLATPSPSAILDHERGPHVARALGLQRAFDGVKRPNKTQKTVIPSTKPDPPHKQQGAEASRSVAPTIPVPGSILSIALRRLRTPASAPPKASSSSPESATLPRHGAILEAAKDCPAATSTARNRVEVIPSPSTQPPSTVPPSVAIVLDKQGRRRCEFCPAMVKPKNYVRHRAKEHPEKQK
jgi:hypothetical protein